MEVDFPSEPCTCWIPVSYDPQYGDKLPGDSDRTNVPFRDLDVHHVLPPDPHKYRAQ